MADEFAISPAVAFTEWTAPARRIKVFGAKPASVFSSASCLKIGAAVLSMWP
jgi:hypothetical protein